MNGDAVLVLRCQKDDYKAFEEIISLHKDGIYNYIWRMTSNHEDAEDLTQEVFVRAFSSIKKFRSESNIKTWLYRIASNICVDRYRRLHTEKQRIVYLDSRDSEGSADIPDSTNDPHRILADKELQEQVQNALTKLPDKLRIVILLYDIEGMSYEEIAKIANCPVGTIKSRIFNARLKLRDILKGYIGVQ